MLLTATTQTRRKGAVEMADRAGTNLLIIAAIAGCMVMIDFLPSASSTKELPALKMTKIMGPSLRFLYCYS
ncbi:hypothetical protein FHG87_008063 [Trinorchestia longiramus]|nr:hypothetical protein FHG87_008063 [Trinorchestia longiramus]